jgi:hypothetical protein
MFLQKNVDIRTLVNMKDTIFDKYPNSHEITCDEWKKESKKFFLNFPEELEEKLLEDISTGDKIDRTKVTELLDIYQYSPMKLKRDKNKSENLYFIMNSNKRGNPNSKE